MTTTAVKFNVDVHVVIVDVDVVHYKGFFLNPTQTEVFERRLRVGVS